MREMLNGVLPIGAGKHDRSVPLAVGLAVAAVLAYGLHAMWRAPRVPYADAWQFLAEFMATPFPANVLGANNGHFEVFPDIVRVAELAWFAADQRLQLLSGIVLALATWAVAVRLLVAPGGERPVAWAQVLAITLGLFWLGNFRTLMHVNETVHAYAVTLGLVAGIACAWRRGVRASLMATAWACFAAVSFGSGLAVFPALLLVLLARRAAWRDGVAPIAGLLLVLIVHAGLGDGTGRGVADLEPVLSLERLLRWLGGPLIYASWPLWDPAIAERVPSEVARALLVPISSAYASAHGEVELARWPSLAFGLAGVAGLGIAVFGALRTATIGRTFGASVAVFALAVGALIVTVRHGYFEVHPDQLLAPRYVVWSSLFWAGLLVALIDCLSARRATALVLTVFVLAVPSQAFMYAVGAGQRDVAEGVALAAAVGVLETELKRGENEPADIARALPGLEARCAAMFAWPETAWLDRTLPASAELVPVGEAIRVLPVANRLGPPGRRVEFEAPATRAERLLLVDADGSVRGLARREGRGDSWIGWMREATPVAGVRVASRPARGPAGTDDCRSRRRDE